MKGPSHAHNRSHVRSRNLGRSNSRDHSNKRGRSNSNVRKPRRNRARYVLSRRVRSQLLGSRAFSRNSNNRSSKLLRTLRPGEAKAEVKAAAEAREKSRN